MQRSHLLRTCPWSLQSFRKRVAFASLPTGFSWPGPAQASKMPLLQSASLEPWETPTIAGDKSSSPSKSEIPKGGKDPTNQDWLTGQRIYCVDFYSNHWSKKQKHENCLVNLLTALRHYTFHFHICSSGTSGASPAPAPGKSVFRSLLKLTSYLSESNVRKYRW